MDEKTILDFLREVRHPGQGDRNIVELGMVNSIDDEGGKVTVTLGFPKRRDPLTEYLVGATRAALIRNLPAGTETEVKAVVNEAAPEKKRQNIND